MNLRRHARQRHNLGVVEVDFKRAFVGSVNAISIPGQGASVVLYGTHSNLERHAVNASRESVDCSMSTSVMTMGISSAAPPALPTIAKLTGSELAGAPVSVNTTLAMMLDCSQKRGRLCGVSTNKVTGSTEVQIQQAQTTVTKLDSEYPAAAIVAAVINVSNRFYTFIILVSGPLTVGPPGITPHEDACLPLLRNA